MKRRKNKPAATGQDWNGDDWFSRCAWCHEEIDEDSPVFGLSVRLRPEAIGAMQRGKIHPLYLPSAERVVPIMLAKEDSPAAREGKDAMLQVCSEECGKQLQAVLRESLGGDS
jgi:hypothetical protein